MIEQHIHSVSLSSKKFTEDDLRTSLDYISEEIYPGLYNKSSTKFRYIDRRIMKITDIKMEHPNDVVKDLEKNPYNQEIFSLSAGNEDDAQRVCDSIRKHGYQLFRLPIVVAMTPNDAVTVIDGRTRLKLLKQEGFTNVLVDYYICADWSSYHLVSVKSLLDFYY